MKPVYEFLERSAQHTTPAKDLARTLAVDYIYSFIRECKIKRLSMLSLPGPWWTAEKELADYIFRRKKMHVSLHMVACEKDLKLFNLAAIRMVPSRKYGINAKGYNTELDCQVITNKKTRVLFNTDVFKYMEQKMKKFDCIWLDTTNTLPYIDTKLHLVDGVAKEHCIFILTVLRHRDPGLPAIGRLDYACAIMSQYGFELIDQTPYTDTSNMLQLIFRKGKSRELILKSITDDSI